MNKRPKKKKKNRKGMDVITTILVLSSVLVLFVFLTVYKQRKYGVPSEMNIFADIHLLFSIAVMAPILEESTFRLLIPTYLHGSWESQYLDISYIGSVLFGLFHYSGYADLTENTVKIIGTFVVGHTLLLVDNVIYAILIHSAFNITSYTLSRAILVLGRKKKDDDKLLGGTWGCIPGSTQLKWFDIGNDISQYTDADLLDIFDSHIQMNPSTSGYNFLGKLADLSTVIRVAQLKGIDISKPAENGSDLLHFACQSCNESLITGLLHSGDYHLFSEDGLLIPGVRGMVIFDFDISQGRDSNNHITLLQILLRAGVPPGQLMNAIQVWTPIPREPVKCLNWNEPSHCDSDCETETETETSDYESETSDSE